MLDLIIIVQENYSECEKVYFLQVVYQKDENSEMSFGSKSASRCGIKKSRMARYSLTDYQRMSDATQVNYVSSLVSFQSKDFELHKVTVQRAEPTVFTRKKFGSDWDRINTSIV